MIQNADVFEWAARRRQWAAAFAGGIALATVLALGGCGGAGDQRDTAQSDLPRGDYATSGVFPIPREIEPNVDFWRHVYGVWSRHQVAIHDDEHMGVIYEVARLPGAEDGYSAADKAFISARVNYYEGRLADLERRVAANQPLSADDRAILAKFEQAGGTRAIYGASDRVRSQRGMREKFRRGLEISGRYEPAFREIMRSHGLPEDLVYIPHVESSYQTHAKSSAGACGVWQFMPATGKSFMMVNGAVDDRYDPILSSEGAAKYLSQAYRRLGSWPLAITSYNHGQGGMANAKAQYGHDFGKIVTNYQGKAFKFASRNYYAEFMAAREVASHANRYFPEGVNYESPWPHDRLVLRSSMPAHHLASHYGVSTDSLEGLNLHWRGSARSGGLLPAGSTVWLPAGATRRVAGHPPAYTGSSALLASADERPVGQPATAAASSLAFRAVGAVPVDVPRARPEPRLARVEPEPEPVAERRVRPEPAVAQTTPRAPKPTAKAQPKAPPTEARVAKAETKTAKTDGKPAKAAKADTRTAKAETKDTRGAKDSKGPKTAGKEAKGDARTAKTEKEGKAADKASGGKVHVVKSKETLFRVASSNGISVAELRKLNKLGPNDTQVRPGQKLKVGS